MSELFYNYEKVQVFIYDLLILGSIYPYLLSLKNFYSS